LFLNFKKINIEDNLIEIPKGASINIVTNLILEDENIINKKIYLNYLRIYSKFYKKIKFGEFNINNKFTLFKVTNLISNPSNFYREFKIIGGWQTYQLKKLLKEKFNLSNSIPYNDIIADTYNYQSHNDFSEIYNLMKNFKIKFFSKYKDNELLKKYTIEQIMVISSLVEKEGREDNDKRLVSSVILNRLENKLKLEIDATTIFSITKGEYKFDRKLTLKDLKYKDKYNTYFIRGLPPKPICYVSRKTIEIVMENYKSDYLFYFFNEKDDKHIFSKSFNEHKKLLKKYRKNE